MVLAFVTVGLLFRIAQVFRGIELYPDGLIFFALFFMTMPSLILIAIGLYIWFKKKQMKKHPKARKLIDAVAIIAIIVVIIYIVSNPLRQPVDEIEKVLLEDIPIGTPLEDVRLHFIKDESVLATERHGIVNLGDGKYWQTGELSWYNKDEEINSHKEEGGSLYRVGLGEYQGWLPVIRVQAVLVFGADQKLKYIEVMKLSDI